MKKNRLIIVIIFSLIVQTVQAQQSLQSQLIIGNIIYNDGICSIYYTAPDTNAVYNAEARFYSKGQKLNAVNVSGDTSDVCSGSSKKIIWNIQKDGILINDSLTVFLSLFQKQEMDVKKALIKSTFLPGLGNKYVGSNFGGPVYGIIAYGLLGTSVYFLAQPSKSVYTDYKNSYDIDERQNFYSDYEKSINNKRIGTVLLGTGILMWAIDYYTILHKASKTRKTTQPINNNYYFMPKNAVVLKDSRTIFIDQRTAAEKAASDSLINSQNEVVNMVNENIAIADTAEVIANNFQDRYTPVKRIEFNKSLLPKESIAELNTITDILKNNNSFNIEVTGFTDSDGSEEYNQKLSEGRAKVVENYFINNGIDKKRIKTKGNGESNPVAPNTTEDGKAQNRRVEVLIIKK